MWRAALYAIGFDWSGVDRIGRLLQRLVARSATAILVAAGVKLVVYLVNVDAPSGVSNCGRRLRWRAGGVARAVRCMRLSVGERPARHGSSAACLVSLVGGIVQARRVAPHRHFNHNDLYHVIQMVALYLFYRGGALLVDR